MLDLTALLLHFWEKSKYGFAALAGLMVATYIVFEFGSYVITRKLDKMKVDDQIRSAFIDRRARYEMEFQVRMYDIKTRAINLISKTKDNKSIATCNQFKNEIDDIEKVEDEIISEGSDLKYFFGLEVRDDSSKLIKWLDNNKNNCFYNITNPEEELNKKVFIIQKKMWDQMYPKELIEGLR